MQLAGEVIEYHHRVGDHQQDIRRTQRVRVGTVAELTLDVAHTVVAEIAHQSAIEARQPFDRRNPVALLEGLDEGQRVLDLQAFRLDPIDGHPHLIAVNAQHGAARQSDDRVSPPLLTALDGFEQIGVRRVGQFQVQRQRGVEVGERLERQGDAVVAFVGQTQEFFAGHVSLVV